MDTVSLDDVKYHIDASVGRRHPLPLRLVHSVPEVDVEVKEAEAQDSVAVDGQ